MGEQSFRTFVICESAATDNTFPWSRDFGTRRISCGETCCVRPYAEKLFNHMPNLVNTCQTPIRQGNFLCVAERRASYFARLRRCIFFRFPVITLSILFPIRCTFYTFYSPTPMIRTPASSPLHIYTCLYITPGIVSRLVPSFPRVIPLFPWYFL